MAKLCVCNRRQLGKGRTAALVAGGAAVAATAAIAHKANGIVTDAFMRRRVTDNKAFFEKLASDMPGTTGLDFAESRAQVQRTIRTLQTNLYENAEVERVSIPGSKPSEPAVAYVYRPEQESNRWVIMAHGYRGTHYDMDGYADYYVKRGYNVLSPDLHTEGESGGRYVGMGAVEAADILLWVDYVLVRFGEDCQIVLHGQSMGAAAVLIAAGAGLPSQVKAVVADSSYTSALAMVRNDAFRAKLPGDAIAVAVAAILKLRGGVDLARADVLSAVKRSVTPTVFLHGGNDPWVPSTMAVDLYTNAAPELRELHVIPGAGHVEGFAKDPDVYFGFVDAFLAKAGVEE